MNIEGLKPGWYPAAKCWDAHEGVFPEAVYFDGKEFQNTRFIIAFRREHFESEMYAEDQARTFDYEDGHEGWERMP